MCEFDLLFDLQKQYKRMHAMQLWSTEQFVEISLDDVFLQ